VANFRWTCLRSEDLKEEKVVATSGGEYTTLA